MYQITSCAFPWSLHQQLEQWKDAYLVVKFAKSMLNIRSVCVGSCAPRGAAYMRWLRERYTTYGKSGICIMWKRCSIMKAQDSGSRNFICPTSRKADIIIFIFHAAQYVRGRIHIYTRRHTIFASACLVFCSQLCKALPDPKSHLRLAQGIVKRRKCGSFCLEQSFKISMAASDTFLSRFFLS